MNTNQILDIRESYKTAVIAKTGSIFQEGEVVQVSVKRYIKQVGWFFACRKGGRVANYAEVSLRDFK